MEAKAPESTPDRNSHVRPHIWRADELAKEFKFNEAVSEYDFIISHGVDLPSDFYAQRGYFKYRALDFAGCVSDCTIALASKPELTSAIYNRAAANKELGNEQASLVDLERLLEIDPDHVLGLYLRAFLYGDTGQWERSISAWESYIRLRPDDCRPRLYRGIAFAETGRKREAINEYQKGSEINPKFKSFYFRRWTLFKEINEPELAQKEFEAGMAILHEPDDATPQDMRDPAVHRADEKIQELMKKSREGDNS